MDIIKFPGFVEDACFQRSTTQKGNSAEPNALQTKYTMEKNASVSKATTKFQGFVEDACFQRSTTQKGNNAEPNALLFLFTLILSFFVCAKLPTSWSIMNA
jgi:hypothetical protein